MVLPFIVYGGNQTEIEAIKKAQKQVERLEKQLKLGPEANRYYKKAVEQARKAIKDCCSHRMPQLEAYRKMLEKTYGMDRRQLAKQLVSPASSEIKHYLLPDERIYIFMSSSVPLVTWNNYAKDIDKVRDPNIIMVMRGCIGGCKYIRPTLKFIQNIIIPGGIENMDYSRENL